MSLITSKNTEKLEPASSSSISPVQAPDTVDAMAADRFSQLVNPEDTASPESKLDTATEEEPTLADIQQRFIDTTFRTGFNKTMERAREIAKEMKE